MKNIKYHFLWYFYELLRVFWAVSSGYGLYFVFFIKVIYF